MRKTIERIKNTFALILAVALTLQVTGAGLPKSVAAAGKSSIRTEQPVTAAGVAEEATTTDDTVCRYAGQTPEQILASLTLDQKTAQMVMPAVYNLTENPERQMEFGDYGAVLSKFDSLTAPDWRELVDML